MSKFSLEQEVESFKQLLRLKTTHPNPDLAGCVAWLKKQADELGMSFKTVEFAKDLPIVIQTKEGTDPSLGSVILNCHMDVVPVVEERWTALPSGETPFTAYEDPEGRIYARGSQDMKCVGAQYLNALRRLGKDTKFKRTIHCVWVPDEEIGGPQGMKLFAKSDAFKELNASVAMDEGLAFPEDKFVVFYGERTSLWAKYTAVGPPGHGSKLIPKTAVDRLMAVTSRLSDLRRFNVERLEKDESKTLGDVTTFNITVLQGGTSSDGGKTFAPNVIPSDATITCDVRITYEDYDKVVAELYKLAKDNDLKLEFPNLPPGDEPDVPSPVNSAAGMQWYGIIEQSLSKWCKVEKTIFPAATDSRYIRATGVPAYGFSPMRNLPSLLHDHNEYLTRKAYLEGVDVYTDLIPKLANAPRMPDAKL